MATSPQIEVFFLYDAAGTPLTGQAGMTFSCYKDDLGSNLANPVISEIGGGAYKFTPVLSAGRGIVYVLNTNGAYPARLAKFIRPEDYAPDELLVIAKGKWEIATTGPDADRLIIYAEDGTTVLKKFDLFDSAGIATSQNVFKRTPV